MSAPVFYKMAQVEAMLNLHYQTIRKLIRARILVASGRGKGVLISARSVHALIDWMEQGGDKWQAPRMMGGDRPAAPTAPAVRAASGKTRKRAAGGTRSASKAGSTNTGRLISKPPQRVLNSLRKRSATE
jgi:hypothetical protein